MVLLLHSFTTRSALSSHGIAQAHIITVSSRHLADVAAAAALAAAAADAAAAACSAPPPCQTRWATVPSPLPRARCCPPPPPSPPPTTRSPCPAPTATPLPSSRLCVLLAPEVCPLLQVEWVSRRWGFSRACLRAINFCCNAVAIVAAVPLMLARMPARYKCLLQTAAMRKLQPQSTRSRASAPLSPLTQARCCMCLRRFGFI
jgi:hypothetical protein